MEISKVRFLYSISKIFYLKKSGSSFHLARRKEKEKAEELVDVVKEKTVFLLSEDIIKALFQTYTEDT